MINKRDIINWLEEKDPEKVSQLYEEAFRLKVANVGEKVFLRGLIEISNICAKNCLYCGVRKDNPTSRYELSEEEVLDSAIFALESNYGSLVIQGGERTNTAFISKITRILKKVKSLSLDRNKELGITLSLGEQPLEVYQEWYEAGAHRYLLRIESSNEELYYKIHPDNKLHSFDKRLQALKDLKDLKYQVGTGVMIGLPFQSTEILADDLLFFKNMDIDMCGMGPYLEHNQTPLYEYKHLLLPKEERLTLSLKMVALLRHIMPDINIAATTAMQVINAQGREMAVKAGANIIMPNLTEATHRSKYQIYNDKPGINDDASITKSKLEQNLAEMKIPIGWDQWGDSMHYLKAKQT